ncbi:hypothetical protein U0035_07835 [Niabella yanshanensis]|uniref:Immunity protein 43 domain-containing protein n=1 Tax=Niabella yanshanensis TaxID=577386 RepID=A0ABZ0W9U2_9BACT|nr:hypothetical protein [Niabella yanshanensis]WQD40053.1 hypothetical protein U0035_07835 [Niabella yanshanensis]
MNYYIFSNNYSQRTSSAADGILAEGYDKNNPFPPMKYSWTKPRDLDRVYPSELYYIFKGIDFYLDYASFWDGYIISGAFKNLLDTLKCPSYKSVKLKVVNAKGEDISGGREYFFIDMRSVVQDVVDYTNSLFTLNEDIIKMRGLSIEKIRNSGDYFGNIKVYEKISLLEQNISYNIFKLKDLAVHDLICDEQGHQKIQEFFNTIQHVNIADMTQYNNRFN